MSAAGGPLRQGPEHKPVGWRFGSVLLGLATLILVARLIVDAFVEIGLGRLMVVLAVLGVLLSVPYGLQVVRGRTPPPPEDEPAVPVATVAGPSGSTYVVVSPGVGRPGGPVRVRELEGVWYLLYLMLWRGPMLMGDAELTALWRGIDRAAGGSETPRRPAELTSDWEEARLRHPERQDP